MHCLSLFLSILFFQTHSLSLFRSFLPIYALYPPFSNPFPYFISSFSTAHPPFPLPFSFSPLFPTHAFLSHLRFLPHLSCPPLLQPLSLLHFSLSSSSHSHPLPLPSISPLSPHSPPSPLLTPPPPSGSRRERVRDGLAVLWQGRVRQPAPLRAREPLVRPPHQLRSAGEYG